MVTKEECYVSKKSADKLFEVLCIKIVDGKLIHLKDRLKDVGFNRPRHPIPSEWIVHMGYYTYLWDPWDMLYRTYFRSVGVIDDKKITCDSTKRMDISEHEYTLDPGVFNNVNPLMKEESLTLKRLLFIDTQVKIGKLTIEEALEIPRGSIDVKVSSWDME